MIWVEPYERMVNPASSSNFGTNTAAEAGGLNETKQKTVRRFSRRDFQDHQLCTISYQHSDQY